MSKYIDAEKLKAEIERRKEELERDKYINIDAKTCRQSELKYLERFIDSLPEEKPSEDLEDASQYSGILTYPMPDDGDIEKVMKVQEARIFHEIGFKAGAEWQRIQTPMPEDTVIFMKGVEEGRRLERDEREENKRKEDELPRYYGD